METGKCSHTSLALVSFDDRFAFTCNGCKELGYGPCYTCHQQCNYHLHKECQLRTPTISHPFFAQAHFVLDQTDTSPATSLCVACGMSMGGWRYVLTANDRSFDLSLHPCCVNLPYSSNVNGEMFTLNHETLESLNMCCAHCRQSSGARGWAYVSTRLNIGVHVKCIKDMHHQCWEKNYYTPTNNQALAVPVAPPSPQLFSGDSNNNYQVAAYQERGLNQQQRRFRKRDLFFGAANLALCAFGVGDTSSAVLLLLGLARNIWGSH